MDLATVRADHSRLLRGILLVLLALAGGLIVALLLPGPTAAASPAAAPVLLDEVADDAVAPPGHLAEKTPEQASPPPVDPATERSSAAGSVVEPIETVVETVQPVEAVVETVQPVEAVERVETVVETVKPVETVTESASALVEGAVETGESVLEEPAIAAALEPVARVVKTSAATVGDVAGSTSDPIDPVVPDLDDVGGNFAEERSLADHDRVQDTADSTQLIEERRAQPTSVFALSSGTTAGGEEGSSTPARPGGINLGPAGSPEPAGPGAATPAGSVGSTAFGSPSFAVVDSARPVDSLSVTSSQLQNDDVPAPPTYESDTTPD